MRLLRLKSETKTMNDSLTLYLFLTHWLNIREIRGVFVGQLSLPCPIKWDQNHTSGNCNLVIPKTGAKHELLFNKPASRVTRRLEKNDQFLQRIAQKVAKSKKGQNIYNKAQLENPKHLHQTSFNTLFR
jgi:hypothetical protein